MVQTHKEKILVLVKTTPKPSLQYTETVCTAGIREDGSWVRLYPISFRLLSRDQKYRKFQWIECFVYKSQKDKRPESFHIDNDRKIVLGEAIDCKNNWAKRRHLLKNCRVFSKTNDLLGLSKSNIASLAIFRPKTCKFYVRKKSRIELEKSKNQMIQLRLNFFDDKTLETFKHVDDIPYNFYYKITDECGNDSVYQIFDWEIESLYHHYKESGEKVAVEKVKQKYGIEFLNENKDLLFFMGTGYKSFIRNRPNPWMIIGVLPLPAKRSYQTYFDF